MYLTIDPGTRVCGVAVWREDKTLDSAWACKPVDVAKLLGAGGWSAIYVETPVAVRGNARPEDIIKLAVQAGRFLGRSGVAVSPGDWKGSCTKAVTWERCKRILSDDEIERMVDQKWDTRDAVGLGLVCLGRAKRGVV